MCRGLLNESHHAPRLRAQLQLFCVQMLVLAHLYAKTDSASLATLRSALQRKRYTAAEIGVGAGIAISVTAGMHIVTSVQSASCHLRDNQ